MSSCVPGGVFSLELLDTRDGFISCRVSGPKVKEIFRFEPGGHRYQRVSPTEKRGRVHTSTITIAVLDELEAIQISIPDSELEWGTCRSGGSGGQHVNKTNSAVQLKHLPTGLMVRVESRSQSQNKVEALRLLKARLLQQKKSAVSQEREQDRREQVGTGQRGDKVRTIRIQDDTVTDHTTGNKLSYKNYSRGIWDDLIGV